MSDYKHQWWEESYGFFGDFYMQGDDSKEGYLIQKKQNLQERTSTEVDGIIQLLNLEKGAELLDCPCGYGRHSIELAKRGFNVTGVDINERHLSIARERTLADLANVEFIKANMLKLEFKEEFAAVINMFYSFGFFETDQENFEVLKNFYRALKPKGRFLMHTDVNIPRILAGKYRTDETRNLVNGKQLRIIDRYDEATKRIHGSWILRDENNQEIQKDYSVRVYSQEEFIALCREAGFRVFETYSDWDKGPYSPEAEDMIIVATK